MDSKSNAVIICNKPFSKTVHKPKDSVKISKNIVGTKLNSTSPLFPLLHNTKISKVDYSEIYFLYTILESVEPC